MTPAEREQGERQILEEYQQSLACLEVLHHRISSTKRTLKHLSANLEANLYFDLESLTEIEGLRATIEDYERTHTRCKELYDSLKRLNLAGALRDVPYRPYRLMAQAEDEQVERGAVVAVRGPASQASHRPGHALDQASVASRSPLR